MLLIDIHILVGQVIDVEMISDSYGSKLRLYLFDLQSL